MTTCSLEQKPEQTAKKFAKVLSADRNRARVIIAFSPKEAEIARELFDRIGGISCNFIPKGKDITYVFWGFSASENIQIVIVMTSIDDEQARDIVAKMAGRKIPSKNIVVAAIIDCRKTKDGPTVVSLN